MAQTHVDAAVMRQTAARFDEVGRGLEAMLNNLMAELEALRASGTGYDATDVQAAGRIAATNRGMTLPL